MISLFLRQYFFLFLFYMSFSISFQVSFKSNQISYTLNGYSQAFISNSFPDKSNINKQISPDYTLTCTDKHPHLCCYHHDISAIGPSGLLQKDPVIVAFWEFQTNPIISESENLTEICWKISKFSFEIKKINTNFKQNANDMEKNCQFKLISEGYE